MKHLFLQGNIRVGKSTLIKDILKKYRLDIGGYFVQRIFIKDQYKGFSVYDIHQEPYVLNRNLEDIHEAKNLFLYEGQKGKWLSNESIFEKVALDALKNREQKNLILMDELGGIELKSPVVMGKILKLLSEDIPVLGVLKSIKNIGKMQKKVDDLRDPYGYYEKIVNHDRVQIFNINEKNLLEGKQQVLEFVRRAYSHEKLDTSTN